MLRWHNAVGMTVTVSIDDISVRVPAGTTVAAALLVHAEAPYRTSAVSGAARAPYCMIGQCFECVVEVDGQRNVQACLVPVREGMRIRRQTTAREMPA